VPAAVVVALAVDAPPQTGLGEDLLVELPSLPALDLGLEDADLILQR
jgi:hypothetical protein